MADADLDTDYIKVTLTRPVEEDGPGRVIIVKTYEDAKSCYLDGNAIVFKRPLGIESALSCSSAARVRMRFLVDPLRVPDLQRLGGSCAIRNDLFWAAPDSEEREY